MCIRDSLRAVRLDGHAQQRGRAGDDAGELLSGVELQPQRDTEAVAQGAGELTGPRGGADAVSYTHLDTQGCAVVIPTGQTVYVPELLLSLIHI